MILRSLSSLLRSGGPAVMSLLYPAHCGACGCRIETVDRVEGEQGHCEICKGCRQQIIPQSEHLCPVCSHLMTGLFLCPNCDGRHWHLSVIVAACHHEGLIRDLIHRFKYGRDQSLVSLLGELLLPALEDPRMKGRKFDAIVPVPLHPLKEREREFNQSKLLASYLAKHLGIPVVDLLKRTRPTAPQARFDRIRRMENLEGAFALRALRQEILMDANLLLVDDVTTTGTTLDACAAILLEAGAAEVCAVTVARG